MRRKPLFIFTFVFLVCLTICFNCYAVTEAEVQAAVDSSNKETVSGNLFVWFLCAIAFMKVSQKIDSFMSSLGISVGRTGSSLMAEAMIAGRAIGTGFQVAGKFGGFGKGHLSGGESAHADEGGFFNGIGKRMAASASRDATGKGASGGMMASISRRMYQNSVGKGGAFAASVIGSVARGEISKMGTISGPNGKAAMESYFGYNALASVDKKESGSSTMNVEHGGSTNITSDSNLSGNIGFDAGGQPFGSDTSPIDMSSGGGVDYSSGTGDTIPTFSDIEMGGGRITGIETTADHPDGIQFAMYDAEKYAKPDGDFKTVTAVDNSKWYKQYAVPSVEKTPYMDVNSKIQYNEKIVQKIPKAPLRKDKI